MAWCRAQFVVQSLGSLENRLTTPNIDCSPQPIQRGIDAVVNV